MANNDNFKVIYKILSNLEKALDYENYNTNEIFKTLDISKERYNKLLIMLYENEYIKGIYMKSLGDERIIDFEITLKGLEYLKENTLMKKIRNELSGIFEIIK